MAVLDVYHAVLALCLEGSQQVYPDSLSLLSTEIWKRFLYCNLVWELKHALWLFPDFFHVLQISEVRRLHHSNSE